MDQNQQPVHIIESTFLSDKKRYATEYCTADLDQDMFMFETAHSYDEAAELREVFHLLIDQMDTDRFRFLWASDDPSWEVFLSEYPFLEEIRLGSEEYFRAFALTKTVIGDGPIPCEDLVRKMQLVINILSEEFQRKVRYLYPDKNNPDVWHQTPGSYLDYLTNDELGRRKLFNYVNKRTRIEPVIKIITKSIRREGDDFVVSGSGLTKVHHLNEQHDLSKFSIQIGERTYGIDFRYDKGLPFFRGYRFNRFSFRIPVADLVNADIQNRIFLVYNDTYKGDINYNIIDGKKGKARHSKLFFVDGKTVFLRQTIRNTMYFTVREQAFFDTAEGQRLLRRGYLKSKFMGNRDIVLLYEKESSKYEESASVLFEHLIDAGYDNVYYLLNEDHPKLAALDPKYKAKIIYKYSLDHIAYFFASHKFIGTETMPHAIQLRSVNKRILDKLSDPANEYVFLQHGVMYMVSLNAGMRDGFRKQNIKLHRVVVSSALEAQHFIDLAQYEPEDLYICGLPKFDTAYKYDDADKIIIMPTWRRWEVNEASVDVSNTNYFKMILRIIDAIPADLQNKVIVLPHPLMMEAIRNNEKYNKYLPQGDVVYDELLRHCRLLITDYSSISYDAFFRGSNVIFYWEEKDECMTHYGQYAFLMLNDDNAFGDVCYNQDDLRKVIEQNYHEGQTEEHLAKYRRIVTYHDGKNTERLINYLKNDHVI